MTRSGCDLPDRERMILSYLDGTLADEEADAFEVHCLRCDECAAELERGAEIRAALSAGTTPRPAPVVAARRSFRWPWLAAAASLVLAAAIWKFAPHGPPPAELPTPPAVIPPAATVPPTTPPAVVPTSPPKSPGPGVLRSPSRATLKPIASQDADNSIRLTWTPLADAVRYVVVLNAPDGTEVLTRETSSASIVIEGAWFATRPAGERLFATIEARNALDALVATSTRLRLPARKPESARKQESGR